MNRVLKSKVNLNNRDILNKYVGNIKILKIFKSSSLYAIEGKISYIVGYTVYFKTVYIIWDLQGISEKMI